MYTIKYATLNIVKTLTHAGKSKTQSTEAMNFYWVFTNSCWGNAYVFTDKIRFFFNLNDLYHLVDHAWGGEVSNEG